jgi:hypothetical protein
MSIYMHGNDGLKHLIFWNRGSICRSHCHTANTAPQTLPIGFIDTLQAQE